MRIAVISDIHGNLEALKATLNDIKSRNVDKIICIGDIVAKGKHLKECVELVRENCDVVLQGNCDAHFSRTFTSDDVVDYPKEEIDRIEWNQSMMTEEIKEYLKNLPFSYEFYLSGSLVRLFHSAPDAIRKTILNQHDIETKYKMFLPSENTLSNDVADVVIYGHIHHPFMDKIYNKTLINAGSVGDSFCTIRNESKDSNVMETTRANYLILEGEYGIKEYTSNFSFEFVQVPYDINKEIESLGDMLEKEDYICELTKGMYRDMTKTMENFKKMGIDVDKI